MFPLPKSISKNLMKYKTGFQSVKVNDLVKNQFNYKDNDEVMLGKLSKNIEKNGAIQNLIVRELPTGALEICDGAHRYDVLKEKGEDEVFVFNLGKISDAKAKRICVELNETQFASDKMRLGSLLRDITTEFGIEESLTTLPYSEDELEKLLKLDNWPTGEQKAPKDDGDFITVRLALDFEQHEAYLAWKNECGTDNDVLAVLRAIGDALKYRNQSNEKAEAEA